MPLPALVLGGICRNGHVLEDRNVVWRKAGNGGRYIRCGECERLRAKANKNRKRETPEQKAERWRSYSQKLKRARLAARIQAEEQEDHVVAKWLKQQQAVSAPWNQLALRGDAQVSLQELNEAMELGRTPCFKRPEEFIDFADPRFPEESEGLAEVPSTATVEALCSGCPVWDLCQNYAETAKPDFGVYAGKVYVGGKVYKQKNKKEEIV